MKIAVTGANGQLGSDVCRVCRKSGHAVAELNHEAVDITDGDRIASAIREVCPDVVVNTAAYNHVERCEEHPDVAFLVNALGARNVARACNDQGSYLIHISTDYVFDGVKEAPYLETDLPRPLNIYGNTKLSGEYFVGGCAKQSLVMRTSGLYGKNPCRAKGYDFVELMLKVAGERDEVRVVDNEVLTPTSTLEVSRQIERLCRTPIVGLAHATAEGQCSWYEFAKAIFDITGIETPLHVAEPGEFSAKIRRPRYSVLENHVLKEYRLNTFRDWREGLREHLAAHGEPSVGLKEDP